MQRRAALGGRRRAAALGQDAHLPCLPALLCPPSPPSRLPGRHRHLLLHGGWLARLAHVMEQGMHACVRSADCGAYRTARPAVVQHALPTLLCAAGQLPVPVHPRLRGHEGGDSCEVIACRHQRWAARRHCAGWASESCSKDGDSLPWQPGCSWTDCIPVCPQQAQKACPACPLLVVPAEEALPPPDRRLHGGRRLHHQ